MRRRSRAGGKPVKARHRKAAMTPKRLNAPKVRGRANPAPDRDTEIVRLARERDEALEQQTATAEVLQIISASPTELRPVLDIVVRSAARFCEADDVTIFELDGENLHIAAHWGAVPQEIGVRFPCTRGSVAGRTVIDRKPVQVIDLQAEAEEFPEGSAFARRLGVRTQGGVPLLRGGVAIGTIQLRRTEVNPFTDKQLALLGTFAAQAVIAIENARLLNELRQRTTDLSESLEQQTATSEVLRVISASPGELEPVFQAMLENATRVCASKFGTMYLKEGNAFRTVAMHGAPEAYVEARMREPVFHPGPGTGLARAVETKQIVDIADVTTEKAYRDRDPLRVAAVQLGGVRSHVSVPLLKENELIGVISIYRQEVRPFTDKQIDLLKNFAAQAVIAIENTRLLNELRQRTDDLSKALEQQTATSEVLRVISSSPGELEPVFQSMLANAVRICEAKFGFMYRHDSDTWEVTAVHGAAPVYAKYAQGVKQPGPETVVARIARTKQIVHIADLAASQGYAERDPLVVKAVEVGGVRTLLGVPMLKDNEVVGAIVIYRQEVRPFSDKQIDLVKNFANQAVIAIENARLLNELRESLDQQSATSTVLKVISSSPGELEPVFNAMLENATRICEAKVGNLFLWEGNDFRAVAVHGESDYANWFRRDPMARTGDQPGSPLDRLVRSKQVIHIPDLRQDQSYIDGHQRIVSLVETAGARTHLVVPMLKDRELVGAIIIYRREVRPFTDKQIELVKNFAAQAVIAIENARLLNELRESLQQQTATADVLKVISRSTFDLKSVLQTLVESAAKLCDADSATISRQINGVFYRAESYGLSREFMDYVKDMRIEADRGSLMGRVLLEGRVIHIPDVKADPEYTFVEAQKLGGYRTSLGVPMLREGVPIGVLSLNRSEVRPFTDKQIELVTTFADQAVIAIENARLLNELRESLDQQSATADVLKVISRSTFDLRPVLQTLVESAARFCAADNATVIREKDGLFYTAEAYGYSRGFLDYIRNTPIKAERGSASGRALVEGRVIHIPDVKADAEYTFVEAPRLGDFRTALCVPMLRDGVPIGLLTLTRSEVKPFTDKQIELVTTFADQAAIAIENVRLFDEIRDKSRQLEEASQHKSQFLANMSHELRTPLNAILGYTELMADGAYGEPSEKMLGILKRLEANGRHLLGLINDVLDLSKIEAGQLVLDLSDYSIQDIAQTVRSTLEPLATDKKLAFKVEMSPDLPPGRGDGRRLTQVLINLVGNAIKFTDAGEVAIKAQANDGTFHVSVRDTGPGISAADQANLFQEFQQADNAITRKKGGTGLGLAISKRIIEMHGGEIWVESQSGQGSTFAFSLPVIVERQVEAV
jgi:GAF domain-containing protein